MLFIDDGSSVECAEKVASLLRETAHFSYEVISHQKNLGLAAARNTALSATSADVLINLDLDDVALPDFVRDIWQALESSPQSAVCMPDMASFADGTDYNQTMHPKTSRYRPVGDGIIASQVYNQLGHANAGVRVAAARALGGWDQTTKAKWEDWELYLRVLASGGHILVIPKVGVLYRVRQNSMVRTYSEWGTSMQRLAKCGVGLPRYEGLRLQACLRSYQALMERRSASDSARLKEVREELKALRARRAVRLVEGITAHLRRYPRFFGQSATASTPAGRLRRACVD